MQSAMATQAVTKTLYDDQTAETIIRRLTNGETMLAITRDIGIDRGVFYAWKRERPELEAAFEEARLIGAEMIAQDALRIVDGDDLEDLVPMDLDGVRGLVNRKTQLAAAGGDPVARARLRFEGRMKLLSKWFPAHYGDKLLHAGHDGGAIKSETALSVKELAAQLRARASGITIDNDSGLTDASTRFNADGVSNEGQSSDQLQQRDSSDRGAQGGRLQAQRNPGVLDEDEQGGRLVRRARQPGNRRGAAQQSGPAVGRAGLLDVALPVEGGAPAAGPVAASAGDAGRKRRTRGVGDRGGALKRGASPEMGGTPAPQIREVSQSVTSTEHLSFPADDDWDPEDYV
jgi:hypothetical protein